MSSWEPVRDSLPIVLMDESLEGLGQPPCSVQGRPNCCAVQQRDQILSHLSKGHQQRAPTHVWRFLAGRHRDVRRINNHTDGLWLTLSPVYGTEGRTFESYRAR